MAVFRDGRKTRRILFALMVVSLLAFGLSSEGEGAQKTWTSCISYITYKIDTPGKVGVTFLVTSRFVFTPDGIKHAMEPPLLTHAELATFEPLLASLRAAAAARVEVSVQFDDKTYRVGSISILWNKRCP